MKDVGAAGLTLDLFASHEEAEEDEGLRGARQSHCRGVEMRVRLTESVVQGMASQPIVRQTWKGRNRLYSTVTVHRWTRYLCSDGERGSGHVTAYGEETRTRTGWAW